MATDNENKVPMEALIARGGFAFVSLAQGASFLWQRPQVAPQREFISMMEFPLTVFGIAFMAVGLTIAVVMWRSSGRWMSRVLQVGALVWFLTALAYLPPVAADPREVLWTAMTAFIFIGGMHQSGAILEAKRRVGAYNHV